MNAPYIDPVIVTGMDIPIITGLYGSFLPTVYKVYEASEVMIRMIEMSRFYNEIMIDRNINSGVLVELRKLNSFLQTGAIDTTKVHL